MRAVAFVFALAACAGPDTASHLDRIPPDVLAHQRPGADTSGNPEITHSEACNWLARILGCGAPEPASGPGRPTEYYHGCHGCSSNGDAGPVLVVFAALLVSRRRRVAHAGRQLATR
jgi:uncharacterized protein (TIGR03382 family)